MATYAPGFGYCPNDERIVQLLQEKAVNPDFTDDGWIKDTQVYEQDPQKLYNEGINSGNELRWFFSRLENGNRRTPSGGMWKSQGKRNNIGNGDAKEKSFAYEQNDERWLMKEYALNDAPQWAIYCLQKIRQ